MPRLYHTKSRNGCIRCKERHVKCDEARPKCRGCKRHGVECVYIGSNTGGINSTSPPGQAVSQEQQQQPQQRLRASGTSFQQNSIPQFFEEGRERRYRELQLLHFFTVHVAPTLPGACLPEVRRLWSIDSVRMSFTYEPLLNCILAMSLQAMRWITDASDSSSGDLINQRARYFEATIRDHRNAIKSLTKDTADPVAVVCQLLAIDAFAGLQDRSLTPYRPPMEWLYLSRGVRHIMVSVRTLVWDVPGSKARMILEYGRTFYEGAIADRAKNRAVFGSLLDDMDEHTRASPDGEAYDDTVCYIGSIWMAQQQIEDILLTSRRLVVFGTLMNTRFVELLDAQDPRALVILAHFFAVVASCRNLWWIGRCPSREILAIETLLGPDWRQAMEWPTQIARKWQ